MKDSLDLKNIIIYSLFLVIGYFFIKTFSFSLVPVLTSLVFVAILNPVVVKLEKIKIPRVVGSALAIVLFLIFIIGIFGFSLPFLYKKINITIASINKSLFIENFIISCNNALKAFPGNFKFSQQDLINYFSANIDIINFLSSNFLKSTEKIITFMFLAILSLCLSFLMLKDLPAISETILNTIPVKHKKAFEEIIKELNDNIFNYLHGQFIVAIFLFCFYSVTLYALNIKFFLIISIIAGLSTFVPYIGAYFSFLIAFFLISEDSVNFFPNLIKLISSLSLGQLIEGNFITPKVMGKKIGINPVFFLTGTLFCIPIFGFLGIILGTPLTIILSVFIKKLIIKYKNSSLYSN